MFDVFFFFFQAEDGIRDADVTGVQTCALPEVQEKLKDLKHDIEKGVNDRDKYQDYINYERNKVDEIKEVWSYYRETTDEYYKLFDSLHPVIKNLGDSLARSAND